MWVFPGFRRLGAFHGQDFAILNEWLTPNGFEIALED